MNFIFAFLVPILEQIQAIKSMRLKLQPTGNKMSFHLKDSKLVSDTTGREYLVNKEFRHILETVTTDPVPQPIVMLGILTEQLLPVDEDLESHIQIVEENINEASTVTVSVKTFKRIRWLLGESKGSLDTKRKKTIGELVSKTNLNSPSSTNSSTSQSQTKETKETEQVENTPKGGENKEQASDETSNSATGESDRKTKYDTSSDTGKIFDCEFCEKQFQYKSKLMSHVIECEERPQDARYQCKYCNNEYVSGEALNRHLERCGEKEGTVNNKRKSGSSSHICGKCGSRFDSVQMLLEHKRSTCMMDSPIHSSKQSKNVLVETGATGKVVHFNQEEGYGFIQVYNMIQNDNPNSSSLDDVFFHVSKYPTSKAREGEIVKFDIKRTGDGYRAVNISYANSSQVESWDETFASLRPRWGRNS